MENILNFFRRIIPSPVFRFFQPAYHYLLAFFAAAAYGFPSRKIKVIAVTGTKGKTSTAEILSAIFEEDGLKTAILGTLRFKINDKEEPNLLKMTMPGRFFVQRFIKEALKNKCDYVLVEMTSQGVQQFRHKFIALDALIFTNLAPEHIESHGSYEKYKQAKLEIAKALSKSKKRPRTLVVNKDDKEAGDFLRIPVDNALTYSLADAEPHKTHEKGIEFTLENETVSSSLLGQFNIYNILAAATLAKNYGVSINVIKKAVARLAGIRGRMEQVEAGQNFQVIVDYAHTPDSLEKAYKALAGKKLICVLGNTGGGRDKWKRKVMGEIADKHCATIILTNEDPYDEDPIKIVEEMKEGIKKTPCEIIIDRREAIRKTIALGREWGDKSAVIITGKGTDPYIMGPNNTKIPWDDRAVAKEELYNATYSQT